MIVRRIYCICLLLLCMMMAQANLVVTSFRYNQSDATANTKTTERFDQNGERCALIKVETTQTGFHFDVGSLGVTHTEQHPGEIWVYVPHSVKRITIQHAQLGVLRDWEFPEPIRSACTYIMKLNTGTVETIVHQAIQSQYLLFRVSPENAILDVTHNNEETTWTVRDGEARHFVPFGNYQYRVSADGYHTEVGAIVVNDMEKTQVMEVTLRPNFGWLKLVSNDDLEGATVFVDDKQCGAVPYQSDRIKSGKHTLRLVKRMYKSYSQEIFIKDNETLTLSPKLMANFAELTLKVANNAEIWINGDNKGNGQWSGNLEVGEYKVETKLSGYRSQVRALKVTSDMRHQTITLSDPTPIYGTLMVETLPNGATIYLDGRVVGETPKLLTNVLAGNHDVQIQKANYANLTTSVTIVEGQIAKVEGELMSAEGNDRRQEDEKKEISYRTPWYEDGHMLETFIVGEFAYATTPQMAYGGMIGQTYYGAGWYIKGHSNFKFYSDQYKATTQWAGAELECDEEGKYQGVLLHYSGKTYSTEWMATAGFVGDVLDWANVPKDRFTTFGFYLGAGYGVREMYWETNYKMENGQQAIVKYAPTSIRGFAMDAGLLGSVYGFTYKVGVSTIKFKYTELEVGIGWMF